jgi:predicted dehydrogenase
VNHHPTIRFRVVGIDHRHIYDQVRSLLDAGAECAGYWTPTEVSTEKGFVERFPHILRVDDRRRLLEDGTIQLITCAAIPRDRAAFAIEAMQHGKDFMADKPGVISFEQLRRVMQVQQETGRIFSVNFTERFEVRAVTKAIELVRAGSIGRVIQTVGLGPHRLNRHLRPAWFFDPQAYGGILIDIASHQIDQFLHFTGSEDADIVAARYGNLAHPDDPGLQDFGEIMLAHGSASGYIRVDWFTPDGLDTWGDGRLVILGTDGYIELRKYIDIAGRPGKDHLYLVNHEGACHIDCSQESLPFYADMLRDVVERTERAMSHRHCFKVCELALKAQSSAIRVESKGIDMSTVNNQTIGFGLIGAGMIANYHAQAIRAAGKSHNIRLAGVAGLDEVKLRRFAQQHDVPFHTTDIDALLARPDIQVVCILTPSGAHLEPALKAIAARKHLIVEKPLEVTLARVDAMIDAARTANVNIAAIFQARFSPGARALKAALDAGRFGRLCLCSAYVKWHRSTDYYQGWKGTLALDGGGAVMNQAIHALDLLRWFAGMPAEVFAWKTRRVHTGIETEDTACATFRFPDGALGMLEATTAAYPGWERRIEICGERGSVAIEDDRIARWDFIDAQPEDIVLPESARSPTSGSGAGAPDQISFYGHQLQIEEMASAIRTGRPLTIDVEEARNTVALVCGVYQSAERGVPVSLSAI